MTIGRKKKCRTLQVDVADLWCHCFGPIGASKKEIQNLPKNFLLADELQTLIYQDVDGLKMQQGADKMGISKTVYAGIYATAKKKLVNFVLTRSVLSITK